LALWQCDLQICKSLFKVDTGKNMLHTFITFSTVTKRTHFQVVWERRLEMVTVQVFVSVEVCKSYHRTTFYRRPAHKSHISTITKTNNNRLLATITATAASATAPTTTTATAFSFCLSGLHFCWCRISVKLSCYALFLPSFSRFHPFHATSLLSPKAIYPSHLRFSPSPSPVPSSTLLSFSLQTDKDLLICNINTWLTNVSLSSEWVSNFLMAHQHIIGSSEPSKGG